MTEAASPTARPIAWSTLIRRLHLWVGMLIAPSVLMFAFSGGLQIFRLQEAHPGYSPPGMIEKLGRLHKDQVFAPARKKPARAAPAAEAPTIPAPPEKAKPAPTLSKRLLRGFFTLVAAGLFVSTLLGVWMGVAISRWRVSARWLLAAGTVLPIVLILLPG